MRAGLRRSLRLHEAVLAREVLGVGHPLVHVLELQDLVRRDLLVLCALVPAVLGGLVLGLESAAWLAGATAATAAALGAGAAILLLRRREAAIGLILEGRAQLPLPAVAEERERLLNPAYRRMLARSLALIRRGAEARSPWPALYCAPMIRGVADELRELEALLTRKAVDVRGVALTYELLVDGRSPLHGSDPRRLSEELQRIAAILRQPCAAIG
jgi:hypothetical protein